jgi:hypothetical protein
MDMKGVFDTVAMEGLADASQPQRSLRQPVVLFDCIA